MSKRDMEEEVDDTRRQLRKMFSYLYIYDLINKVHSIQSEVFNIKNREKQLQQKVDKIEVQIE